MPTTPAFPPRPRRLLPTVLLLGLALFAHTPQAFAERADKDKPAVINADKNSGDDINQVRLFTGDVVLTKGTILLRADQLTIRQDPEGYNLGVAVATQPSKRAYFKQKREGADEFIEGQAERIEYDEKSDTIRLFNRAVVKRLAAGRDADETQGDRIDYNTRTERYQSQMNESAAAAAGGARPPRTTTILQPKIKPGTSAVPGSDGGIAPPVSSPSIELKSTPSIDATPRS